MNHKIPLHPIRFGTDGIRGDANNYPFDNHTLEAMGYAIALWAREKYASIQPHVLMGMDTRESGPRIKVALTRGLVRGGAFVVDGGVLPTPAVCNVALRSKRFDLGIVISASHNPYQDNGIKVFDARHTKLPAADEENLLIAINAAVAADYRAPLVGGAAHSWPQALDTYVQDVCARFKPGFLAGQRVLIDAAHGATYQAAQRIFEQLGAEVTMLFAEPNGTNINDGCGATHPEALAAEVVKRNASIGFAFDGDGDRIVAVSAQGQIKDGDDILALLFGLPKYQAPEMVVGTVMSNQGLDAFFNEHGKRLVRTAVGDKYVAQAMQQEKALLGAEVSGHVIVGDYLLTSDGMVVALNVMESIILNHNQQLKTFNKYPQKLINVPVRDKKDLQTQPFAAIIAASQERLAGGRLLVRYSGTELLLRVMAEAPTRELAEAVAGEVAAQLKVELDK